MALLNEFSIQLYSLREETATDFAGTLRKVAEIGYTGVEFAGYGDLPATEMKALLDELGLKSVGSHVGIEKLRDHFEEEMEYNRIIGTEAIIVPYYEMKSLADVNKAIAEFKELAPKVKAAGFTFGYHNHANEFETFEGTYALDLLTQALSPDEMFLELDLYWTAYAGVDYIEYLQRQAGHIRMLHIKQINDFEEKRCVDLGDGVIDFEEIIRIGQKNGILHYILEQEEFEISPFTSVKNGFDYIMSL